MDKINYLVYTHDAMGYVQNTVKRIVDFCLALIGLVVLSPVYLIIIILLKIQRNGPVIFSQERIGKNGRPFTIYKFRTMKDGIEDMEPQLNAIVDKEMSTLFERFLRRHHLDELPQLWNVVRGDMAIVGPRPEREYFINQIMEQNHDYELIYEMLPGLTSEATLYNGYTDTMEKMLRRLHMDIHYLENRSLLLDAKIIADTVLSIITGKKF